MDFFASLFGDVDATLVAFVADAVTGLAGYVNNGVRLAGIVAVILLGIELQWSPAQLGVKKIVGTFLLIALVSQLATIPANYNAYIGNHLLQLPDDLLMALAPRDFSTTAAIGEYLDKTISAMLDGISKIWHSGSLGNYFGPAILAGILFFLLCVLGAAAVVTIMIAKVGIALVVALGPLMAMMLLTPWTKDFFTRWVSYALHFSVLQLLIGGTVLIASTILDKYVNALTMADGSNDPVVMMAPAVVMIVLAYLFSQLPSMASSLTGGIGLASGNLAWGAVSWGAAKAGWHLGGKYKTAHDTAAQQRRVQASREAQQGREQSRRNFRSRVWNKMVGRDNAVRPAAPRAENATDERRTKQ